MKKSILNIILMTFLSFNLFPAASITSVEDNKLDTQLLEAVKDNNIEKAKQLIESGADVNVIDPGLSFCRDVPPLYWAVMQQNEEMVRLLINLKADINLSDKYKKSSESICNYNSPLTLAIAGGNINIIYLLLKSGADVNFANNVKYIMLNTLP